MQIVAFIAGLTLVLFTGADMVNTLISTHTSNHRNWLTRRFYITAWRTLRALGRRLSNSGRETLYARFAPASIVLLLAVWSALQVVGFGLIWWSFGGLNNQISIFDSIYYSGVVYFTVGFGEFVPTEAVPRLGAIIEALTGVMSVALVIGFIPALYAAFSTREQKLLTLDDGSEQRITPTNLVKARCPNGDPHDLLEYLASWESWVAEIMETHRSFTMLMLFRSQHPGQHWITALGLITDAALHAEIMTETEGRSGYWLIRRTTRLLQMLTQDADISSYERVRTDEDIARFQELYDDLEDHGFDLISFEQATERGRELRSLYAPRMEYLIDLLDAPRGFWGHKIGYTRDFGYRYLNEESPFPNA